MACAHTRPTSARGALTFGPAPHDMTVLPSAAFFFDLRALYGLTISMLVVWMAVRERERERAERERAERAERERAERERAERERAERERAELFSKVESVEQRMLAQMGRVLSEEAYVHAHRCVFALSWKKGGVPHGVGVLCGAPGIAVSAAHNFTNNPRVKRVFGSVYPFVGDAEESKVITVLALEVVKLNLELDVATLRVMPPLTWPHFLECFTGPPGRIAGSASLALCTFQLAIQEDLPDFGIGLGVMTASAVRLSPNLRHVLYSCTTYAGDSGAALLLRDGQLVGIHLEFVNALRESLDRKTSIDSRLSDVEESLAALVAGAGQGTSVAVLSTQFDLDCSVAKEELPRARRRR